MSKPLVIMPCLDMMNGRVVKGVNFVNIRDAGDPVECCRAYCAAGADEIAMLDITATVESRATMLEVVKKVAAVKTVPFTMGGGISSVQAAEAVLAALDGGARVADVDEVDSLDHSTVHHVEARHYNQWLAHSVISCSVSIASHSNSFSSFR